MLVYASQAIRRTGTGVVRSEGSGVFSSENTVLITIYSRGEVRDIQPTILNIPTLQLDSVYDHRRFSSVQL